MTLDEAIRLIESGVLPENGRRLRSEVRRWASKQALVRLEEGGVDGPTPETRQRAEVNAYSYCREIISLIRRAWFEHRHLTLDFNLFVLLRDTLNNRAQVFLADAINRHAPDKQQATMGVEEWTEHLTPQQLRDINAELRYEKVPPAQVEDAYFDTVVTVRLLQSVQLAFVALSEKEDSTSDVDAFIFEAFLVMLKAAEYDIQSALEAMRDSVEQAMSVKANALRQPGFVATDAYLPGWVVTSAGPWDKVLLRLRERLPLKLQSKPFVLPSEPPEGWDWLCKDGGPLLVCWGQFQVAQPGGYVKYRCRQLSAICSCLDTTVDESIDDLDSLWPDGSTVACRAINVPLNVPWAAGRPPFERGGLRITGRSHLMLPRLPWQDGEHIRRLEERGLSAVLIWINDEGNQNGRVARALDAFETARSLGGRFGSLPPAVEEGWRVAALCTSLEQLFCAQSMRGPDRVNHVQEQVRRILGDQAAAVTKLGFNRRNERVHENAGDQWDEFPEFAQTVKRTVGAELCRSAGVRWTG